MNKQFQYLVSLFRKLPGVGPRQAGRFILALLERSPSELQELGGAIATLRDSIRFCTECFNLSDNLPDRQAGELCNICTDGRRDRTKLLVVEKITDLNSIERTGLYRGLYHVLGGAINPVDGIGPEKLTIGKLQGRLQESRKDGRKTELIIATNPSTTGEMTALYLGDMFSGHAELQVTRLARGLASGSNLEYADEMTLKHALDHRK